MLKLETVFQNKIIITGVKEPELQKFVEFMIEYAWTHTKVPANLRQVKEAQYPSLDKLPKTFNIKETAERAIKRSALIMETVGAVYVGLNARVHNMKTGANTGIKIEVDKFVFERDDQPRNLTKFLTEMIAAWGQKDVPKVELGNKPATAKKTPEELKASEDAIRKKMFGQLVEAAEKAREEEKAVPEKLAAKFDEAEKVQKKKKKVAVNKKVARKVISPSKKKKAASKK